jgi:DnaJ family protein C protein 7
MLKDYKKALDDALTAISLDDIGKYYTRAVKCFLALGDLTGAIKLLSESSHTWTKELENLKSIQTLLKTCRESDPDVALVSIENCFLLIDPSIKAGPWVPNRSRLIGADLTLIYSGWQCIRAKCLEQTGNIAEAFKVTFDILSKEANHVEAMALRAKYLYILDKQPVESILSILSKTLSLDPDNKEAFALLKGIKKVNGIKNKGNDAFSKRDWSESLQFYGQCLDLMNELGKAFSVGVPYAKVLSNRGNVYSKMSKFKETVDDVSSAINLLNSLNFPDSFKDTNATLDFETSVNSDLYYKLFLRRADSYMKLEEYEDAVRDYKIVSKMKPGDRGIFNFLMQ